MSGYLGQILTVNLTTSAIGTMPLPEAQRRDFIGGSGLAAALLYPRLTADLDPLGPDNPLLFLAGPLTGTAGAPVGRYTVCAKSPATGRWAESNCGGFFGPEMRFAGYDGIRITGRAASPVYLWIEDDRAELRPADHLWRQADTYATQSRIRAEVGSPGARVACIGVAGEAESPLGLILCDHGRVAGRTGLGAVMGSKRLKAVAVRGRGKIPLADGAAFGRLRAAVNRDLRDDTLSQSLRLGGSASASDFFDLLGLMPKRHYTRSVHEGAARVGGAQMHDTILTGVSTCHGCVIACGRVVAVRDGVFAAPQGKGPEYETIVGFGPNLLVDSLPAITHLGRLCDAYGFDTISLSNAIGLVYDLVSEGIVRPEQLGGLRPEWGDPSAAEAMVHLAARGEGIGHWLRQGARALARHFGAEARAVQVNGLEVAYHDPRGGSGMALVYATSPRGACHNQSDYYMVEAGQSVEEIGVSLHDRQAARGKAGSVARHQDWRTVCNSLVVCLFAYTSPETVLRLTNAATGFDYSLDELLECGERAWNLKRAINHRLGLTRADDRLPKRLLEPLPDGPSAGLVPDLAAMLSEYYAVRGWDADTGRPARDTLRRLRLPEVADDLWGDPA